ncbi:MAG: MATE family efflux transporter, partial [Treponemataceae bacterium]|nr:MATE family efflux transporter [Treponemataceae bacterium]
LGVPENVFPMALTYLRIYLLGLPLIFLYNFESAILRSRGNTRTPLLSLFISGLINVALNFFFVLILKMDVDGVALATVISNFVSTGILFVYLLRTKDKVRVNIKKLAIDRYVLIKILKIGIPSGIQGMVFSLSNIVVQSAINSLGQTVMAASTAAFYLEIIAYYVMNSFSQTCTTFIGQNYGAGQHDRCRKILKDCFFVSLVTTGIVCISIYLSGRFLLSLFNSDPQVIETGMIRLRYIFLAYIFSFAQEVFTGYLRGYGISNVPAICTLICVCGIRLVWVFTVFRMRPAFSTIMQVYPVSLGLIAFILILMTLIIRPSRRFENKSDI